MEFSEAKSKIREMILQTGIRDDLVATYLRIGVDELDSLLNNPLSEITRAAVLDMFELCLGHGVGRSPKDLNQIIIALGHPGLTNEETIDLFDAFKNSPAQAKIGQEIARIKNRLMVQPDFENPEERREWDKFLKEKLEKFLDEMGNEHYDLLQQNEQLLEINKGLLTVVDLGNQLKPNMTTLLASYEREVYREYGFISLGFSLGLLANLITGSNMTPVGIWLFIAGGVTTAILLVFASGKKFSRHGGNL